MESKTQLRILEHRQTAAWHMALDEVLLEESALGASPPSIRFLEFSPSVVLLGQHQILEQEVNEEYCRKEGIDINRRLSGGGAIYWQESSLGWEISGLLGAYPFNCTQEQLQYRLCKAVAEALRLLGIEAGFRPRNDIEVNGRKISGTGGVFEGRAFLFQGSLLVKREHDHFLTALRTPVDKLKRHALESMLQRICFIDDFITPLPSLNSIKKTLTEAFCTALGVDAVAGGLTWTEELKLAERLSHFESEEWIYGSTQKLKHCVFKESRLQSGGGFINARLWVAEGSGIIQQARLSGDFFCSSIRLVADLENALHNVRATAAELETCIKNFFSEREQRIFRVTPDKIVELLIMAARAEQPVSIKTAKAGGACSRVAQACDEGASVKLPDKVDVLVAGCGPAGLCAALSAAGAGGTVLAVDSNPHIGSRPHCAEYVPALLAGLVHIPDRAIAQRVEGMETVLQGGATYTRVPGLMLDRAVFEFGLAAQAAQAGARIEAGWKAELIGGQYGNSLKVALRRGSVTHELSASVLVAADGAKSAFQRNNPATAQHYLTGMQIEVPLRQPLQRTRIFFHPQWRHGYAWLFPKGGTANLGLGMREYKAGEAKALLVQLQEKMQAGGLVGPGVLRRNNGAICIKGMHGLLYDGQMLFAGDAAGLTHPITGAGVSQAIISGLAAGRAAAAFLTGGGSSAFSAYECEMRAHFGESLAWALKRRRDLEDNWCSEGFERLILRNWPAFKEYSVIKRSYEANRTL